MKTPEQCELSLTVNSGPVGRLRNGWACIEYRVTLNHKGRPIWSGPFALGVGHVKPYTYDQPLEMRAADLTADEENCSHHWARGTNLKPCQLLADTAAKLARAQKVAPTLDEVAASVLLDGEAYFEAYSFAEWADMFGYSPDSITAHNTYQECQETGRQLTRGLPVETLAGLREWAQQR